MSAINKTEPLYHFYESAVTEIPFLKSKALINKASAKFPQGAIEQRKFQGKLTTEVRCTNMRSIAQFIRGKNALIKLFRVEIYNDYSILICMVIFS